MHKFKNNISFMNIDIFKGYSRPDFFPIQIMLLSTRYLIVQPIELIFANFQNFFNYFPIISSFLLFCLFSCDHQVLTTSESPFTENAHAWSFTFMGSNEYVGIYTPLY